MLPKWHILLGTTFFLILFLVFNVSFLNSLIVFLSSVLIDVDHYLYYFFKKKDLNLSRAYKWHKSLSLYHKPQMQIFYTFEFLLIVVIISFISKPFVFIITGLLFHSIIDFFGMLYRKNLTNREYSFLNYLRNDKKNYL